MKIHCDQCGFRVRPLDNFCTICGAEVPRRTLPVNVKIPKINAAVFCPSCSEQNIPDGLYCSSCGEHLFKYSPVENNVYCPRCGEKNGRNAKICTSCTLSFLDWVSMKGDVAKSIGWNGNVLLHETQTDISYVILREKIVTLGRNGKNSIKIPCQFVSANHCAIGLAKRELADLNSGNGTFINGSSKKIQTARLDSVYEFNIAGYFTFIIFRKADLFILRLKSILDEDDCFREGDRVMIEKLRQSYFILPIGNGEIFIRKFDGTIETNYKSGEKYYNLKILDGFYYLSDASNNVDMQLVLKKHNRLPKNWEINLL